MPKPTFEPNSFVVKTELPDDYREPQLETLAIIPFSPLYAYYNHEPISHDEAIFHNN